MSILETLYYVRRRGRIVENLPAYAARALHYGWLTLSDTPVDIPIWFGDVQFLMHIEPLSVRQGSRGIFLFRERYEPLLMFGRDLVKPGDVVFDLGANQGIYCCAFGAAVGSGGRVIAVEPIPRQTERLRANIALNAFPHCTVVEKAISDRVGTAVLHIGEGDTAASIVHGDADSTMIVETTTIDELVREHALPRVDFLKLDVEGAELLALKGAAETLERHHPGLALEMSDEQFDDIHDHVAALGYEMFVFDDQGRLRPIAGLDTAEFNVICLHGAGDPDDHPEPCGVSDQRTTKRPDSYTH